MSSDLALSVLRRLRREPSADTPLEVLARDRWRRHREIADTTG